MKRWHIDEKISKHLKMFTSPLNVMYVSEKVSPFMLFIYQICEIMRSLIGLKSSCSKNSRKADAWRAIIKSAFDFCHFRRSISLPFQMFHNFVILSSKMITLTTDSPSFLNFCRDIARWYFLIFKYNFVDVTVHKRSKWVDCQI